MLIRMRTTLVLDDDLLREAKIRAARQNVTVSDLVNRALRDALHEEEAPAPPFTLVTYGRGGSLVDHAPADFAVALEQDDRVHAD
jgi:plasmid stability protein